MRSPLLIILSLLCAALLIQSCESQANEFSNPTDTDSMSFEAYEPISTLKVKGKVLTQSKFPFVDVHSHHYGMPEQDLDKLIKEMDVMNMGVIVNLSGRGRGEQSHFDGVMANIKKYGYEDRIKVFTNLNYNGIDDPDWGKNMAEQVARDVAAGAVGLKIYKTLGLRAKDADGKRIAVDDPRIDPVWAMCGKLGIPVLIHAADPANFWLPQDRFNERWLELKEKPGRKRSDTDPAPFETILAEQHHVFEKHPNTTFINAHFGWMANDLERLGKLMDQFPNMYTEMGAIIAELGRQPITAKKFLTKYQNRVLFGKDSYRPEEYNVYFRVLESSDEYFPYYRKRHAFWKMYGIDLDDEVLERIYYKNAVDIIPSLSLEQFQK